MNWGIFIYMRIIITESKLERLKEFVKTNDIKSTIKLMGGVDTFRKVLNVETPKDFLHQLFDGMSKSEIKGDTVYYFRKNYSLLLIKKIPNIDKIVIFSRYTEFWEPLKLVYGFNMSQIKKVFKEWFGETYGMNMKNVSVEPWYYNYDYPKENEQ